MSNQNALFAVAAIVLVVAALSLGFTYYSISSFKQGFLTGHVTANGTIYINITSSVAINFTTASINWGSGSMNSGATYAILSTSDDTNPVQNGTWSSVTNGFVLENIGNVNVTVNIKSGKTNATFFPGSTNPQYKFNVTNNEAGSCVNQTFNLGQFYDTNITEPGTRICSNFSYGPPGNAADTIMIDILLGIPIDVQTGSNLSDQIQVTALQSAG